MERIIFLFFTVSKSITKRDQNWSTVTISTNLNCVFKFSLATFNPRADQYQTAIILSLGYESIEIFLFPSSTKQYYQNCSLMTFPTILKEGFKFYLSKLFKPRFLQRQKIIVETPLFLFLVRKIQDFTYIFLCTLGQ